ncbi:hypothetical protein BGCPKDLD_4876 [Methylorubrum suomiense]|uniref:Uncharacterized protein n=1 Tax=Methylorubrum suomiense TaxID=144191 RepID=A0ABQ4V726_9HYPH|nr:hypothetical protein BGCPKDLD_4876 [Methylorubrum suomiense]
MAPALKPQTSSPFFDKADPRIPGINTTTFLYMLPPRRPEPFLPSWLHPRSARQLAKVGDSHNHMLPLVFSS